MGDDHHEGQRVGRRSLVAGVSALGFGGLLAACSGAVRTSTGASVTPGASTAANLTDLFRDVGSCTLSTAATQGPYYFDADRIRSDIREDRQGHRLRLALRIQDGDCQPLPNAVVEIWHCDAGGLYSGAEAQSNGASGAPGGPPPGPPPGDGTGAPGGGTPPAGGDPGTRDLTPTDDRRYLRGAQVTNSDGIVEFTTIWPGWYRGRTVHIHVMVHVDNTRVLTTQLMFDETENTTILARKPYSDKPGRDTVNDTDSIFTQDMLVKTVPDNDGHLAVHILNSPNK